MGYTFKPNSWSSDEIFTASNLNLYYDLRHPNWYKRPDWFAVVGIPRMYEGKDLRLSYVLWQELVSPFVVVELLSPGTEAEDLGGTVRQPEDPPTKWQVYEQILRVPYYFAFSRYTDRLQAFRLVGGHYELTIPTDEFLPMPEIGLSLGIWQGNYHECDRLWLRWFTIDGTLILTPDEQTAEAKQQLAEAEQQAAETKQQLAEAEQRAIEAERRAEQLAARLRELGIDDRT